MAAEGSAGLIGTCLCHSLWSERGSLGGSWGGRQAWGHTTIFSRLLLSPLLGWPGSDVPEDLHNEQVDGEHEEGALKANHHFLPCELDLTCQGQTEGRRKNNPRQNKPSSLFLVKKPTYSTLASRFCCLSICLPKQWGGLLPKSIFCSAGSFGTPQNMMLVSMVQRSSEKQQDTRWARVKELRGERLKTEYQMCPSWKPWEVFMRNRLLGRRRGKSNGYVKRRGKNKALVQGSNLFMLLGTIRRNN